MTEKMTADMIIGRVLSLVSWDEVDLMVDTIGVVMSPAGVVGSGE
jgi:hypothetical protein